VSGATATRPSTDVLIITARRLADDDHGAGVRTARIAEVLADRYRVTVAEPAAPGTEAVDADPARITFTPGDLDLTRAIARGSTEGASLWRGLDPVLPALEATGAPVVFWADAILASAGLGRVLPDAVHVVEFANVESRRYLAMALDGSVKRRLFALLEAGKAVGWQRTVARRSDALVALSRSDATAIRSRKPKLLVRNGIRMPAEPAPRSTGSTLLAVGSWWYGPNRHGMRHFLQHDWPRIRAAVPAARLLVVGKGGADLVGSLPAGVEVLGFVDDLDALYDDAALVLAPARSGGGSQLKIVGALAHERIVVGPAFLARERTPDLPDGALQAAPDAAANIVRLLGAPAERHDIERRIGEWARSRSWRHEAEPLLRFIDDALPAGAGQAAR
jgi:hypothetical protein